MNPLFYAQQIAYSSKETLRFTYEMAKKFKDTPGVYVECGVAAGAQIIAMAYGAEDKEIYAFDSFLGIPLPSNRDDQMPGIKLLTESERKALPNPGEQVLESSGATAVDLETFWDHVRRSGVYSGNVFTVKGWFEETIPKFCDEYKFAPMEGINILRLDGDLYNSTYVCLKHLYPRTLTGSCVIVDDYGLIGCRQAVEDYFTNDLREPMPDIRLVSSGVVYWIV